MCSTELNCVVSGHQLFFVSSVFCDAVSIPNSGCLHIYGSLVFCTATRSPLPLPPSTVVYVRKAELLVADWEVGMTSEYSEIGNRAPERNGHKPGDYTGFICVLKLLGEICRTENKVREIF